jgi:pentatricopeptide repeat protein
MGLGRSFSLCCNFLLYLLAAVYLSQGGQAFSSLLPVPAVTRQDRMAPINRQIKGCKTVEAALALLNAYIEKTPADQISDDPFVSVLHICGKTKNLKQARQLYAKRPSEACQRVLIQICGKCGDHREALRVLRCRDSPPSVGTYHAAMAACGQAGAWKTVLELFAEIHPAAWRHSTLTHNIVLTALARSKRGDEALTLLKTMTDPPPDRVSYHKTVMALCSMGDVDAAHDLCLTKCPEDSAASDLVISAYSKREQWDMVRMVQCELNREVGSHDFMLWGGSMIKVGKGRNAHWELGTWTEGESVLTVALQPNRNPAKNGIKLLLIEGEAKIGYLLMINSVANTESCMIGAYLDPEQRKRGLSKIIIGVWASICLEAGVRTVTGIINKPLLALVLQETFGFIAADAGGVEVEISRGTNGAIVLFSPTKAIQGSFSPPDIKRENIIFADTHADPKGRMVKVQATFGPPSVEELKKRVDPILKGKSGLGAFTHKQSGETLRTLLLGK